MAAVLLGGCVTLGPTQAPTTTPGGSASPSGGATAAPTTSTGTPTPAATGSTGIPAPSSSGSAAPGTPGPSIDPGVVAQIEAVIASVPAVRGLEPLSDVPYEFISREDFRDQFIELAFSEIPEETFLADERMLKRLGLVPADADLKTLLTDLYGAGVLAFYRDDTKRFYVIESGEPFGPGDKVTVAHEYTHALQDQHFDLEGTRIKDLTQGDASLGQIAAIEGDASFTMLEWAQSNLTEMELIEFFLEGLGQAGQQDLEGIPWVLRRQLEYPYLEGFTFSQRVHAAGGFDAINDTITDPPESSEQILHPEKYTADEQPVAETIGVSAAPGFESVYQQTLGELIMQVWVAGDEAPVPTLPGMPVEWPHAHTAAGWGGDRLEMFEAADDRWAIVWETAWDTEADMQEFANRAGQVLFDLDAFSRTAPGPDTANHEHVIVLASDQETLDAFSAP
jgi:hypothetical protein